jgi:hypothetical protein
MVAPDKKFRATVSAASQVSRGSDQPSCDIIANLPSTSTAQHSCLNLTATVGDSVQARANNVPKATISG